MNEATDNPALHKIFETKAQQERLMEKIRPTIEKASETLANQVARSQPRGDHGSVTP